MHTLLHIIHSQGHFLGCKMMLINPGPWEGAWAALLKMWNTLMIFFPFCLWVKYCFLKLCMWPVNFFESAPNLAPCGGNAGCQTVLWGEAPVVSLREPNPLALSWRIWGSKEVLLSALGKSLEGRISNVFSCFPPCSQSYQLQLSMVDLQHMPRVTVRVW